jgi:hypothetical protein
MGILICRIPNVSSETTMKKIIALSIAIALFINIAKAQKAWVDYKIDDLFSVKMPTQPSMLAEDNFYVRTKDTCIYIISKLDLKKLTGLDSATIATQSTTAAFSNSFKTGMANQMPGSEFGEVNIGKWHDYTSYNINGINAAKKLKIYTFMVFVGAKAYSLMAILPETKSTSGKDFYFGSLVMN